MRTPSSALRLCLPLALLLLGTSACVYRMNIQQGNYLEPKALEQLQVGMTRSQVRYLLGTPMVPEAFDDDRWDYLYYIKQGRLRTPHQRHLTVFFDEDKVSRIDRHEAAASAPPKPAPDPAPVADAAQATSPQSPP
jgi:outer membrane protein assembly factor BamE